MSIIATMKLITTLASTLSLLRLSSACMITNILYDLETQQILSGSVWDNGIYHCTTAFADFPWSSSSNAVFRCETGDWNAELFYDRGGVDATWKYTMQVTPGGSREPLNFELQQVCAGSMEALSTLETGRDPPSKEVSSCTVMQLKAFEYGCTEEKKAQKLLPKVRRRGLASF